MSKLFLKGMIFVSVCLLETMVAFAAPRDTAVAAWLFDEGGGTVVSDLLGRHDGEIFGDVDWTSEGKFGGAVEFLGAVGAGDRIEIPDAPDLTLEEWTITSWAKVLPPDHGGWTIIVVKDPADGFQNYALDLNPGGAVVAEATTGGMWSQNANSTTSLYLEEEWHFLAASYDGEFLQVYVDGELEGEQAFPPGDQSDAPISIGDRLTATQPLLGIVDEVGLFSSALSEEDLNRIMIDGLRATLVGNSGDFDGNGQLDAADIDALSAAISVGTNDLQYDLNGDALVSQDDLIVWVHDLKNTYIGDADLNGEFNSGDLVVVLARARSRSPRRRSGPRVISMVTARPTRAIWWRRWPTAATSWDRG